MDKTQEEKRLHDLLVMAQRGRDGKDILIYCTNCAEPNESENELCPTCRTLSREQVREWMSESLMDNGWVVIGPYKYEPTRVLKSVDPIAYNEMFLDMCDSLARDGYIIQGYNDNE